MDDKVEILAKALFAEDRDYIDADDIERAWSDAHPWPASYFEKLAAAAIKVVECW